MKINKYLLTGFGALALGAVTASAAVTRTWTDAQGRKVEAAFIKLDGDTIYIQTADGSVHPLPLSRARLRSRLAGTACSGAPRRRAANRLGCVRGT